MFSLIYKQLYSYFWSDLLEYSLLEFHYCWLHSASWVVYCALFWLGLSALCFCFYNICYNRAAKTLVRPHSYSNLCRENDKSYPTSEGREPRGVSNRAHIFELSARILWGGFHVEHLLIRGEARMQSSRVLCVLKRCRKVFFYLAVSELLHGMELSHYATVSGSENIWGDVEGLPSAFY